MEYAVSSTRRSTNLPPSSPSRLSPQSYHHEDQNPPIPKCSSHDSPRRRVPRHAQHYPSSPPSMRSVHSKRTSASSYGSLRPTSPGMTHRDDASSIDRLSVIASPSLTEADYFRRDSNCSLNQNDSHTGGLRRPKSTSSFSRSATAALSPGRAVSNNARHHSSSKSCLPQYSLPSRREEGGAMTISSRRSDTSMNPQRPLSTPQRTNRKQNSNMGHWSADSTTSSGDGGSHRRTSWNSSPAQLAMPILDVDDVQQHVHKTRRVVEELHRSYGASVEKRCLALSNTCLLFDHNKEHLHNVELTNNSLSEVAKLLFLHQQQLSHANVDLLHLILSATEMLFRGSPAAITTAFHSIPHPYNAIDSGGILFLQTLLRLLDRLEMPSKTIRTKQSSTNNLSPEDPEILLNQKIIHNIGLILISYTRSAELRTMLYQNSELLTEWTKISSVTRDGTGSMIRRLNPESRLCRLQILAQLIQNSDNLHRELLYHSCGLSETVLRLANFDPVDSVRQAAAGCLVEFTGAPKNCQSMAKDEKYLGTLVKMILLEESSVPNSTSIDIRESALTALQNIAFDRLNRPNIVEFKNGLVLEAVKKTLASDVDPKIRRRAAGTVVNLVGEETVECIVTYKGLLESLALVANKDENDDVRMRSVLALTKLASYIADVCKTPSEPSKSYSSVLDALVVASLNKNHCARVTAVVRGIARNHPDQRPTLAQHDGIVDTLTDILHTAPESEEEKTREEDHSESRRSTLHVSERVNAIHAMAHLVNSDDATRVLLCGRPTVLTAIVRAAQFQDTQDVALRVLERLATVTTNRSLLAKCPGLIVAVAEAVEREARAARQLLVVTVASQRSDAEDNRHGLAKALLLSLLLAL